MLDTGSVLKKIKDQTAKKIFIQVPEGLKTRVLGMASDLEKHGLETIISVEPCYGACDLRDREAKSLGCDLILHFGHSDYGIKSSLPVIYDELKMDFNPIPLLKNSLNDLRPYKKISLVTTMQFLSSLDRAKKFLQQNKKKIFIGTSKRGKPGQVLGCDFSAAKNLESVVDCFLFMGSGTFHPLGLSMDVNKPVLFLDFEGSQLLELKDEKRRLQNIRLLQIEKAKSCKNFGVLVSTKPGQMRIKMAWESKRRLEKIGKNAWILVAGELTPDKLLGLQIDCLVNTACPRMREDSGLFKKPILDPDDLEKLTK
jgi:2-(3-amino-3-carboxypropyl)histidine synthase